MSDFDVKEKRFEQDIEEYLITEGGYEKGNPQKFDRKLALDVETFLMFIKSSQSKKWENYQKIYGTDSEKRIVERFCREVKMPLNSINLTVWGRMPYLRSKSACLSILQ